MFSEEHLYSIALRSCKNIGDANFRKLINAFGSASSVWNADKRQLTKVYGISQGMISEIGSSEHLDFAKRELDFCEKNNIQILLRHSGELPFFLDDCIDAPAILYKKGAINESLIPVSIVGTRNMTAYGKDFIRYFLSITKEMNLLTVSGLAYGVDSEVHQQSVGNDVPTVAVLAHGLHTLYPSKNKRLSEQILERGGALITEFNSSHKPDREHFIQRNRIIAGISRNLIVVETAFGGGSISTATFANGYNREVYALPGRITDKYSQGCNHLIYQNKAGTISSVKTLIDNLGLKVPSEAESTGELFPQKSVKVQLSGMQKTLYDIIESHHKINLDDLAEKSDLQTYEILPILLELEILGHIKSFSGRQFAVS
ncbi:MAG: DNA-processing protein DprA [Bergeyella cardium]